MKSICTACLFQVLSPMTDAEFDEAYRQYAPAIYRSIYRVVNNAAIAEDLLQDSFLRFLEKADSERPNMHRAFLFRIGHNLAVDYLKKHGRVLNYESFHDHIDERDNFQESDYKLWREQIVQRIRQENPRLLQIFLLRVDFDLTYDQISAELKIPKRTLMRQAEGLKKLLRQLI